MQLDIVGNISMALCVCASTCICPYKEKYTLKHDKHMIWSWSSLVCSYKNMSGVLNAYPWLSLLLCKKTWNEQFIWIKFVELWNIQGQCWTWQGYICWWFSYKTIRTIWLSFFVETITSGVRNSLTNIVHTHDNIKLICCLKLRLNKVHKRTLWVNFNLVLNILF